MAAIASLILAALIAVGVRWFEITKEWWILFVIFGVSWVILYFVVKTAKGGSGGGGSDWTLFDGGGDSGDGGGGGSD